MKDLLKHAFLASSLLLISCHAKDSKSSNAKDKDTTLTGPYTANYSSHYQIADSKLAVAVLNLLKDFEENAVDRHPDILSDTVTFINPEGYLIKGRDQFLTGSKRYRGTFSSIKTSVDSYVSLNSTDKNIDKVLIHGSQQKTNRQGVSQIVPFHSVWTFNKDGKIDYIREYTAKPLIQR
jgi:hypothetical protein